MRRLVAVALLTLAGCAAASGSNGSSQLRDWRTPAGMPPSKAEFAALVAACQDKSGATRENAPMAGCLADLGLRRAQ